MLDFFDKKNVLHETLELLQHRHSATSMKETPKYVSLFSLYIAQAIPMSFFSTVVPVIMRLENYSLEQIGYFQLIKLPWIFKFLWAPFIDRYSNTNRDYVRWIITSELFYAVTIVAIGFFQLDTSFLTIVVLMVIALMFSATQDIATDAFATRILRVKERGVGNGIQASGSFLGSLLGSGVLLYLYAEMGWQNILFMLALFVTLALLPIYFTGSNTENHLAKNPKPKSLKDALLFFKIPHIGKRILLLFVFYTGVMGIMPMLKPYLVDQAFSVKNIAYISGIVGTAAGAFSAFLAGFAVRRIGEKNAIYLFAFINILAAVSFWFYHHSNHLLWHTYLAVGFVWMAYAMSSTIIYTTSMTMSRSGSEGFDFTFQIVITHFSGILIAILGGKFADNFGYDLLFSVVIAMGILVFVSLPVLYRPNMPIEEEK